MSLVYKKSGTIKFTILLIYPLLANGALFIIKTLIISINKK